MTLIGRKPCQFLALVIAALFFGSCGTSPRQFDSNEWKAGSPSVRGAMAQDIMDRKLLTGKSHAEIETLLGKPDSQDGDGYGYNVITIERCRYFWECRMEVIFDRDSKQVKFVSVSD
jgi:hypothetical protein